MTDEPTNPEHERLRRWRLILGGGNADGIKQPLNGRDQKMDAVLEQLYGGKGGQPFGPGQLRVGQGRPGGKKHQGRKRDGSLDASIPDVSRWLGDIRRYFPASVVRLMQKDAIKRVGLQRLLSEPEFLEMVEPDVGLVSTLLMLKDVIPGETKNTARIIVRKVVEDLMRRLENPLRQAIIGSLNRAIRNRRPRYREIDWNRTIRLNLKHYQQDYETVIPETLIGYGRKRSAAHDVIICIDQSGSMASSLVYASVFGAVMASIPALKTHMVVFDTSVVDLTPHISDPVDLLFGVQLGGGTDINQALAYCQKLIERPNHTTLILITDLFEGGNRERMLRRAGQIADSGVNFVTLLALSDDGTPSYDHHTAARFAEMGIAAFACTPDLFPELMAATMNRRDIWEWATQHGIKLPHVEDDDENTLDLL